MGEESPDLSVAKIPGNWIIDWAVGSVHTFTGSRLLSNFTWQISLQVFIMASIGGAVQRIFWRSWVYLTVLASNPAAPLFLSHHHHDRHHAHDNYNQSAWRPTWGHTSSRCAVLTALTMLLILEANFFLFALGRLSSEKRGKWNSLIDIKGRAFLTFCEVKERWTFPYSHLADPPLTKTMQQSSN